MRCKKLHNVKENGIRKAVDKNAGEFIDIESHDSDVVEADYFGLS